MTTIRDQSTAALAEALRSLGDRYPIFRQSPSGGDLGGEVWYEHGQLGTAILAAFPPLARRLDFGTAWDEAEAELPEEWMLQVGHTLYEPERGYGAIAHRRDHGHPDPRDGEAILFRPDPADFVGAYGPTPTDALVALTDALRERAR